WMTIDHSSTQPVYFDHYRFSEAGMTVIDDSRKTIVRLSQGLPHYTHSLALYSAQHALNDNRLQVTKDDVNVAVKTTINRSESILRAYVRATSSPQKQNLYSRVLLACALAPKDALGYFSASDVRSPMTTIMEKPYDIPAFSRHLYDFCDDARGAILQRRGDPRRYRFRFVNPLMQPFVIMYGLANQLIDEVTIAKSATDWRHNQEGFKGDIVG
ncbi:MAG: hypothetical protein KY445_06400, partial [Armatimonadetes bacterium]|nr:hypothetical protein [Armatimonadota bacterium]